MKENVFENPVEVRTAIPSPHFDDRRVAARAQRVVPLTEIRTRSRLRKLLYLGGAFAIAIVLGAASALVAVYIKHASNANSQIQLTSNTQPEAGNTDSEPVTESASSAPVEAEAVTDPVVLPKKQTTLVERPKIVAKQNTPLEPKRRGVEPNEDEQLEQIRDSVLYDQWQERRQRRVMRREQRRNRGDRNLSRIDELFEGPRRPERRIDPNYPR